MLKKYIILTLGFININSCLKEDISSHSQIKASYCSICAAAVCGSLKAHKEEKHSCSICKKIVETNLAAHLYLSHFIK